MVYYRDVLLVTVNISKEISCYHFITFNFRKPKVLQSLQAIIQGIQVHLLCQHSSYFSVGLTTDPQARNLYNKVRV